MISVEMINERHLFFVDVVSFLDHYEVFYFHFNVKIKDLPLEVRYFTNVSNFFFDLSDVYNFGFLPCFSLFSNHNVHDHCVDDGCINFNWPVPNLLNIVVLPIFLI